MTKTGIKVSGPGKLFSLAATIISFTLCGAIPILLGALIGSTWGEEGAHNGIEVALFVFYAITWLTWSSKLVFWLESPATEQVKR